MFRIGIMELGITCAIVVVILIVPMLIARSNDRNNRNYDELNKRLKNIEKNISKKK